MDHTLQRVSLLYFTHIVYSYLQRNEIVMATIADISKLIESSNAKLIVTINKNNNDLKAEIQKLSLSFNEKFIKVHNDLELVQQRCDILADLSMRQDRKKELLVRNIPVLKDESVTTITKTICSVIGFQSPYGIPIAFRLRGATEPAKAPRMTRSQSLTDKGKEKAVQFPSIILKFATDWDAKVFMDRYYLKASLKLSDVGFTSQERIYVSENLTPQNFAIFRLAREMKSAGTVVKTRVRDGIVAVLLSGDNTSFTQIRNIRDLQAMATLASTSTKSTNSSSSIV